ncbi:MAG: hypothetical protein EKK37_01095 [Sphingobacteriales bacterium]|nr:MAG: hypothetical protein EKK37_01095 [Sphingobacteriales bacterium]
MKLYKKIFWFFTSLVVIQSFLPINSPESVLNNNYILSIRLDHIAHMCLLLVWALLFKLAWFPTQRLTLKNFVVFTVAGLVLAALSEVVQLVVPYRSFTMKDLFSNCVGVIIGIPVILLFRTGKSPDAN